MKPVVLRSSMFRCSGLVLFPGHYSDIVGFTFTKTFQSMSEKKQNPGQNKMNIELPEDVAEGTYSNLAIISHSNSEFVIDFVRLVPNVPKAKVKSRVILTPQHAKRLMQALGENIQKYESQHGSIGEPEPTSFPPMNFNTPKAEA